MNGRTNSLILVLLLMLGSALEAAASITLPISHDWTFRVGGLKVGLTGYSPGIFNYRTEIDYGVGYFTTRLPAPVCASLPFLVFVGGYLIFRRRSGSAS